jgi:circadian clock protein KaiC
LQTFPRTFGLSDTPERMKGQRRLSTGIQQLDELLGGGIPEGDSLLLAGPSGSGKSVIASQFIHEGLRHAEPGVIAVFEELPGQYVGRAAKLGLEFDLPEREEALKIIYIRPLDLSVDETVHEIIAAVRQIGGKRVVIDSLAGFEMALAPEFRHEFRESLYRMIGALTRLGVTVCSTRRGRRGLHIHGLEQLRHFISRRRHRAPALRVDQRATAQDAAGGEDARRGAQHRHAGIRDHR